MFQWMFKLQIYTLPVEVKPFRFAGVTPCSWDPETINLIPTLAPPAYFHIVIYIYSHHSHWLRGTMVVPFLHSSVSGRKL
jgi:hypothetical protein